MNHPDRSALKARNRLLAMLVLLCVLDLTLVTIAQDWWAIGRILPTIVVMYFVMQGQNQILNSLLKNEIPYCITTQ